MLLTVKMPSGPADPSHSSGETQKWLPPSLWLVLHMRLLSSSLGRGISASEHVCQAELGWESRILHPSQPLNPGVPELPQVGSGHESEFTC